MGLAIILPDVNFSSKNIGTVTLTRDVAVTAISIIAPDSFTGQTKQMVLDYTPVETKYRGVTWSILEGGDYASIDQDGLLTLKTTANSSTIKIKVISTANQNVTAIKTMVVTYHKEGYNPSLGIQNYGNIYDGLTDTGSLMGVGCYMTCYPYETAKGDGLLTSLRVDIEENRQYKVLVGILDQNNIFIERTSTNVTLNGGKVATDLSSYNIHLNKGELICISPIGSVDGNNDYYEITWDEEQQYISNADTDKKFIHRTDGVTSTFRYTINHAL